MNPKLKLIHWILQTIAGSPASLNLVSGHKYHSRLPSGIRAGLVFITLRLVKLETCQEFVTHFAARDSSVSGFLERKWHNLCIYKVCETEASSLPCWVCVLVLAPRILTVLPGQDRQPLTVRKGKGGGRERSGELRWGNAVSTERLWEGNIPSVMGQIRLLDYRAPFAS